MTLDGRYLRTLLVLHAVADPNILDVCANRGVMWRGLEQHFRVTRMDRDPYPGLDLVGRWQDLPSLFPTRRFDVVAFDPPHLTQAGHGLVDSGYGERYGTRNGVADLAGPTIIPLFRPFLDAARAVLRDERSIILAKIGDVVRSNRRQFQPLEFILAARELRFAPCELEPLPLRGFPYDPKNVNQFHLRSRCYWIVLHVGPSCVGPGVGVAHICAAPWCGRPFRGRADARCCSARCRQRRKRALASERRARVLSIRRFSVTDDLLEPGRRPTRKSTLQTERQSDEQLGI
jgi:hypothetical protein